MASSTKKPAKRLVALALGLGLATAALSSATTVSAQPATPGTAPTVATYVPQPGSATDNHVDTQAFVDAVMARVAEKRAANPSLQAVTIYYNSTNAPSFASQISSSASIWNSSVANVKLARTTGGADFDYYEGNDPSGSYASTDGHGHGYVFIDYAQAQQYYPLRIVAHETGHILGLPDHYSGPCSELMSGGGPGTSCTNAYPNSTESSRVNSLWANGLTKSLEKLNKVG
jgi:snapalysin